MLNHSAVAATTAAAMEQPASWPVLRLVRALVALTKPRVALASVVTVLVAYFSSGGGESLPRVLLLLLASGMAAGGSLAFNQWWERDSDPFMRRTRSRPLPQGALTPRLALAWSVALCLGGCLALLAAFGPLSAALGLAIILVYDGLYTPLKRVTRWATEVGSLSGALLPLLGAATAHRIAFAPAWVLAITLFFWQKPHFFAIGWIHRRDYRAAGLPLLPATDPTGRRTARWIVFYSTLLVASLLVPWLTGILHPISGVIALAGCGFILARALQFLAVPDDRSARRLFHASLLVLPLIFLVVIR